MIRIQGSNAGSGIYFGARSFFCGPIGVGSKVSSLYYRSSLDRLNESKGFFGENNCWNFQVDADLSIAKTMLSMQPSPSDAYPEACDYASTRYLCGNSLVGSGRSSMTSTSKYANACSISDTICKFAKCQVYGGKVIRVEFYEYTITGINSNKINYTWRYRIANKSSGFCSLSLATNPSSGTVLGIAEAYSATSNWVIGSSSYWSVISGIDLFDDEATVSATLQSTINEMILDLNYLEKVDYGMIAQNAVENFSANNVNMLEFFAGLKNPASLVPKLKNLKFLKGIANEYLKVSFGVLPTISDLEEVHGAFRRIRPSVDIHGNRTSYAAYTASATLNDVEHTLEQRVKVAVASNDRELTSLASQLDNIGVLPKLSNIWELIPFSFVIDWFINVGNYIESVELQNRIVHFDVKYATLSWKRTLSKTLDNCNGYYGTVRLIEYDRWVQLTCPTLSPSLETPFDAKSHWLTAAALAITRIK